MRVLFVGAPVDPVPAGDYHARFAATGHNTGNLLIGHGLRRQIAYESYAYGDERDPLTVDEEFDLIAIPAANFIYKDFDLGGLADFLAASKLPILVVGLGAQMPSSAVRDITIPEGSRRFLSIISERCVDIGVRGEFTADVLARMGIKNTTLTGCPSYYATLKSQISIRTPEFHPFFRVSVNGSRNVFEHSFDPDAAKSLESALIRLAQDQRYDYVLQNEFPELDVLLSGEVSEQSYQHLVTLSRRHDLRISPEDYAAYIRTHGRTFFGIDEWSAYIQEKDFSVGSRLHGNLIALINGIPAFLFAHDSRTVELAEFMKIPYRRVDTPGPIKIRHLYEDADYSTFEATFANNYNRYIEFLERNGVPHTLGGRNS